MRNERNLLGFFQQIAHYLGENGDRYIQFVRNSIDCGTFAGVHYKAISGVDKEVLSEVKKTYQRDDEKIKGERLKWG